MNVTIRSIARALSLLRLLNAKSAYSLHDLHLASGLPKPTVFRILMALECEGYVANDGRRGDYRLTSKVRELAAGYTEKSLIVEVATPIVLRVTQEIKWPLAIGTLDGASIVVRFSTMPYSPLAVQTTTLGHRHGLTNSAMGLTYLGFCSAAERRILLDLLRVASPRESLPDRRAILNLIDSTRRRGYGLRLPKKKGDSATVALPIRFADSVAGVLSMTTFGSAMNRQTLQTFRPLLLTVADDIAQSYLFQYERLSASGELAKFRSRGADTKLAGQIS
jgi:IclR family mhp operon transcriptional activator